MQPYLENRIERRDYAEDIYAFVMVANISAALDDVQEQAKLLSLTAKNARALAIRAGNQALGFKVITDFIDEFASQTIALAKEIQGTAHEVAKLASDSARLEDFLMRLDSVDAESSSGCIREQLHAQDRLRGELTLDFRRALKRLEGLLSDIINQMRAATFIASTSKVEAVGADDYRSSLEAVALGISQVAETITIATKHCLKFIGEY